MRQPALSSVTLPLLLAKFTGSVKVGEKAGFLKEPDLVKEILVNSLSRLEGQIRRIPSTSSPSHWSNYTDTSSHYNDEDHSNKRGFVTRALTRSRSSRVLDVGCNTGTYSLLAAELDAKVVAIDSDPQTVDRLCRRGAKNVLPLWVDLAFPTPAIGWENREYSSFLSRCAGKFDMVMMLAVLHHMLVTERVPLEEILGLAAELTRNYLLIEFVAPADPMFQRIVRGREAHHVYLTFERFEAAAAARFELVKSLRIEGLHRCLYLFRLRRAIG